MKIKCPKCGRIIGDTEQSLDAHINCKRCGEQKISIRTASFKDYLNWSNSTKLNGHKATEETHDKSE
jgi:DNA-directed RNA polymerase subunit M/transcription elongation factor TFIIS